MTNTNPTATAQTTVLSAEDVTERQALLHARGIPTRTFGVICPMCNMRFENCQCYIAEEDEL